MEHQERNSLKVKRADTSPLMGSKSNGHLKTVNDLVEGEPYNKRSSIEFGSSHDQGARGSKNSSNSPQKWKHTKKVQELLSRNNELKMKCEDILGVPTFRQTLMPSS